MKQGKLGVVAFRPDPDVAHGLASLSGRGRAEAINRALREYIDREPERLQARQDALHAQADECEAKALLLRGEAAGLTFTISEERKRRTERLENAKRAILEALERYRPEARAEFPHLPAGKAIMETFGVDRAFVQAVIREAPA